MSDAVEDARKALNEEWLSGGSIAQHPVSALDSMRRKDHALHALLAEVERLTAPRTKNEIEAAAAVIRDNDPESGIAHLYADEFRATAQAALAAADKVRATKQEDQS